MYKKRFILKSTGFTLIEVLIVIAIIALLASIAYPSYKSFIRKGHISDALSELSTIALDMEQNYQQNRSYQDTNINNPGQCAATKADSRYFSYSCTTTSRTTFVWTASSLASPTLGAANSYQYTINQEGTRQTSYFEGIQFTTAFDGWKR